jgi:hypothetical protein
MTIPDWIPSAAVGAFVGYVVGAANHRRQEKSSRRLRIEGARDQALSELLDELRPLQRRLDDATLAYTAYEDEPDDEEPPLSAEWWQEEREAVSALRRRWMDEWVASLGDDPQISSYYYRWDLSSRNISVMTVYGNEPPPNMVLEQLDAMYAAELDLKRLGAQILAGRDPRTRPSAIRRWWRGRRAPAGTINVP